MTLVPVPVTSVTARPYSEVAIVRCLRAHDLVREPEGSGSWDLPADSIAVRVGVPLRQAIRALDRLVAAGSVVESPAMGWESWYRLNDLPTPRGARRFRLA